MKSYTDLEQSKRLAEILPLESADMCYPKDAFEYNYSKEPVCHHSGIGLAHPCWSLAALISVLPNFIGDYGKCLYYDVGGYYCGYMVDGDFMLTIKEIKSDNPVDACCELILKLNELNLL